MLSSIARRSVVMTATRRLPYLAVATMSTHSHEQVATMGKLVEDLLESLRWHDVEDEVKEIEHLMAEFKTNHAIAEPDSVFDLDVAQKMQKVTEMLKTIPKPDHDKIGHQIFDLKTLVKGRLYAQ